MQFGEEGVPLQDIQQDLVVGIAGSRDGTCQAVGSRADHFLPGFTNEHREVNANDAGMVISWAELEGTPGRKSHWEVLGHPDTINRGDTTSGASFEGSQSWEVWVYGDDSLSEGMCLTEGSPSWLPDVAIDICHEDDGVPSSLPKSEGS